MPTTPPPPATASHSAAEPAATPSSAGSQPDCRVHYDVPPQVFELLLDTNMNYSSGYYQAGDEDLEVAQVAKMDRIAWYSRLAPGTQVLDVGCGWSGPAIYFAERHGCRVTGITVSPVQREYGLTWAARRGVADRLRLDLVNVLDMPYPDGSFDAILFLESIIHMPEKAHIFARCAQLLRPGGRVFIQESNYDRASRRARYLVDRGFREVNEAFGSTGDVVSAGEMLMQLEEAGLVPEWVEDISSHYQITLAQWLGNLDRNAERMRSVSAQDYRMLRRYLMIALGTYRAGGTCCHMITARKPPR